MQLKQESNTFLDFINDDSVKKEYKKEVNIIDNKKKAKNNIEIKEDLNNSLLKKKNEEYKNKIIELENIIKELKNQLIEKDKLLKEENIKNNRLNKKIKEIEIICNRAKTNYVTELENEIKLFRTYYHFSPNEQLISIRFISTNQDINCSVISKNSDDFSKIEKLLYDKYPKYKDSENYFLVHGNKINKHRTLEENKIRNNDILTLGINNFD